MTQLVTNQSLIQANYRFTDSSWYRTLREKVFSAVMALPSLIGWYFHTSQVDLSSQTSSPSYPALYRIKNVRFLSNHSILTYGTALAAGPTSRLQFSSTCLFAPQRREGISALFPDIQIGKTLLAIPIVLQGWSVDHVVMLVVDTEARTIEFYDSKGLTVKDQAGRRLVSNPSINLETLIQGAMTKYATSADWTLKENTSHHQSDSYNCGVYVSNYMTRRLEGETFAQLEQNGLSFFGAIGAFRDQMMRRIIAFDQQSYRL